MRLLLVVLAGLLLGFTARVGVFARGLRDVAQWPETPEWTSYAGEIDTSRSGGVDAIESFVAMVVTDFDVARCEDLGRQIRLFLREGIGSRKTEFHVWVPKPEDVEAVKRFLSNELISPASINYVDVAERLGIEPATPAIFVVDKGGSFHGVGYTNRTRHVREIAFVDVLHIESIAADGR